MERDKEKGLYIPTFPMHLLPSHERLDDLWWSPRIVVPLVEGKALVPQGCPNSLLHTCHFTDVGGVVVVH